MGRWWCFLDDLELGLDYFGVEFWLRLRIGFLLWPSFRILFILSFRILFRHIAGLFKQHFFQFLVFNPTLTVETIGVTPNLSVVLYKQIRLQRNSVGNIVSIVTGINRVKPKLSEHIIRRIHCLVLFLYLNGLYLLRSLETIQMANFEMRIFIFCLFRPYDLFLSLTYHRARSGGVHQVLLGFKVENLFFIRLLF